MAITLVQKNGSASTGTLNAAPPAWSVTPTVGNLLLIVGCEVNNTNSTWPTTPTGYTAFASTPFGYYTAGIEGMHGMYWKIATAGEATPGHYGETSGTQDWVTYTYEFASPGGWVAAAADREIHSAASSTAGTTKASGSTAVLSQASELAVCLLATSVAVTAGAFSGGFSLAQPTTANGKLFVGWQATASTAALSTTATWITSTQAGVKIATFKTAGGGGTVFTQSLSASMSFVGSTPKKAATRRVTGSMSFSGAVAKTPTTRLLPASITLSGALSKTQTLARALVGAVFQPAGAVSRAENRSLAAGFTPTGALSNLKSIARTVTAGFTPTGAVSRLPGKVLAGVLAPTGSLNRTLSLHQVLDAAVFQPVGALSRATSRRLTAVFTPTGSVASASRGSLTAAFRPTGSIAHGLPGRTLSASIAFTGSIARSTSRLLVSSLIASGVLHTRYIPPAPQLMPGGGGYGAVMSDAFFRRYQVDAKWRHMKRPKL